MDTLYTITSHLVYCGAGLTFMMAVEQLAGRVRSRINYISAAMLACNSVITLGAANFASGVQLEYPLSTWLFVTSVFLTGPLNLFYYRALMEPQKQIPARIKGHMVPPLAVFVFESVFHAQPADEKLRVLAALFTPGSFYPLKAGICIGACMAIAYLVYLTRETITVWKNDAIRIETRIVVGLSVAATATVLLFLAGFLAGNRELYLAAGIMLTAIHAFIFLAHGRHPEFFHLLKREIREKKYRTSMLKGMDTDALQEQIMALMTDECLYRDYDLSLNTLAERLDLTPHQLSQFLNEKLGMNFSNFINSSRIAEASRLLAEDPGRSVISVCFYVGFNSKSAFNNAFRKFTGTNPKDFRREFIASLNFPEHHNS
jgi:AraC-like DNA-binding protein